MTDWNNLADDDLVNKTVESLAGNNIEALVVNDRDEAKALVLQMLPEGAEVMNMTSVTISQCGLDEEINKSGKYESVRNKIMSMDKETQTLEMNRLGSGVPWVVGSVHAVTSDGKILIVSNTGSQLSAYAYAALNVIWVVGAQKIVQDLPQALARAYEHCLLLESQRAKEAYGVEGSSINKLLIIEKEVVPRRIRIVLVKEVLGF